MASTKKAEKQHNGKEVTPLGGGREGGRVVVVGGGGYLVEEDEGKGGCRHYLAGSQPFYGSSHLL